MNEQPPPPRRARPPRAGETPPPLRASPPPLRASPPPLRAPPPPLRAPPPPCVHHRRRCVHHRRRCVNHRRGSVQEGRRLGKERRRSLHEGRRSSNQWRSAVNPVRPAVHHHGWPRHGHNCAGNQLPKFGNQQESFFDCGGLATDDCNMRGNRIPSIRNLFHCVCRQLAGAAPSNWWTLQPDDEVGMSEERRQRSTREKRHRELAVAILLDRQYNIYYTYTIRVLAHALENRPRSTP